MCLEYDSNYVRSVAADAGAAGYAEVNKFDVAVVVKPTLLETSWSPYFEILKRIIHADRWQEVSHHLICATLMMFS